LSGDSRKRKLAIFTGNRAEYSMQYPILKAISVDERLQYYLLVSGAHLKDDFGKSLQEIEKDGFSIEAKIEIDMPHDSLHSTALAIGSGISNISKALEKLRPDLLIVYADRFESFAAMIAGTQMNIPTAHVEGGDYTEGGALDDSVRHAMTKLAHIHFATNEQAAERILRMGEEAWRVHNVGLPALDTIMEGHYATPQEVYSRYNLDHSKPVLLFTQHSVTTEFGEATGQITPSLEALVEAGREWDCQVIITYPNDDAGGKSIVREIEKIKERALPFIQVHPSLGSYYYHGVLNVATACLGNSSSGIKETPVFKCPFINIGSRQQGRLRAENIIDVGYDKAQIKQAIWRCLYDDDFKAKIDQVINPYGAGNAGRKIVDVLATIPINENLLKKKMTY